MQTGEPIKVAAGDTVDFTIALADYDPATYTLKYSFFPADASANPTVVAASDYGDGSFRVQVAAAVTATWATGDWRFVARVELTADPTLETKTVRQGRFEVIPNAFAGAPVDGLSSDEKMVAALEAMLSGKTGVDVSDYAIEGLSLSRYSPTELEQWLEVYRRRVEEQKQAERLALGLPLRNKIVSRF